MGPQLQIIQDALDLIQPRRVLHVGGHTGEELELYRSLEVDWVEPVPEFARHLRHKIPPGAQHRVHCFAASDHEGEAPFFITYGKGNERSPQRGGQSSLLRHTTNLDAYLGRTHVEKEIRVPCRCLDSLFEPVFDLAVIDTQGTEDKVLRGGPKVFRGCKALLIEVEEVTLYEGDCTPAAIDDLCLSYGFLQQWFKHHRRGQREMEWGDALYVKV